MPLIGVTLGARRPTDSDSYFWNLRFYYTKAVEAGGGAPVLIPLGVGTPTLRTIYNGLDGIVISGGGDMDPITYGEEPSPHTKQVDRERDEIEMQLARWAVEDDKPLLAICRGHQVLNVALGGSLIQDIATEVDGSIEHNSDNETYFEKIKHPVTVEPGTRLHHALSINRADLQVNSLHHQAVKRIGQGLEIVARSEDGIIEGLEIPDKRFIIGVQWHPEALIAKHPPMVALFRALTDEAQKGA